MGTASMAGDGPWTVPTTCGDTRWLAANTIQQGGTAAKQEAAAWWQNGVVFGDLILMMLRKETNRSCAKPPRHVLLGGYSAT